MLNISTTTKKSPQETSDEIKQFFGADGLGLELVDDHGNCLSFSGGGGYVKATICEAEGKNQVDFVTAEWDYQVKRFLAKFS